MGSSELPALCPRGISPLAEVCVLGICNPGSAYPAGQLGWHKQIPQQEEVLKPCMQPMLEQSWQRGWSAGWHGERGQGKPPQLSSSCFLWVGGCDAGGYSPLPVGQVSAGLL